MIVYCLFSYCYMVFIIIILVIAFYSCDTIMTFSLTSGLFPVVYTITMNFSKLLDFHLFQVIYLGEISINEVLRNVLNFLKLLNICRLKNCKIVIAELLWGTISTLSFLYKFVLALIFCSFLFCDIVQFLFSSVWEQKAKLK